MVHYIKVLLMTGAACLKSLSEVESNFLGQGDSDCSNEVVMNAAPGVIYTRRI